MGRFLTRDPASYQGGINLYEYCGDGPTVKQDPLGMFSLMDVLNGGIACLAVFSFLFGLDAAHGAAHGSAELCQQISDCASAIFGIFIGSLALSLGPAAVGCIAGLVTGIAQIVGAYICHAMGCNKENPNFACMFMDLLISSIVGCATGGGFGDLNFADSPLGKIIGELVANTISILFGYELDHICSKSSEGGGGNVF